MGRLREMNGELSNNQHRRQSFGALDRNDSADVAGELNTDKLCSLRIATFAELLWGLSPALRGGSPLLCAAAKLQASLGTIRGS